MEWIIGIAAVVQAIAAAASLFAANKIANDAQNREQQREKAGRVAQIRAASAAAKWALDSYRAFEKIADSGKNFEIARSAYKPMALQAALRVLRNADLVVISDENLSEYILALETRLEAALESVAKKLELSAAHFTVPMAHFADTELFNACANVRRHAAELLGEPAPI